MLSLKREVLSKNREAQVVSNFPFIHLPFVKPIKPMKSKPISVYAMPGIPRSLDFFMSCVGAETAEDVINEVAEKLGTTAEDVKGDSRKANVVLARHAAVYVMRIKFNWKTEYIGMMINRHHSSVLHSCKVFKDIWDTDRVMRKKLIDAL